MPRWSVGNFCDAMILFLDTEFTDFHAPELISIGLVSECGRLEFYGERTDFDQRRCNEFVRSDVLPKLGQGPCFTAGELSAALRTWLNRVHALDAAGVVLVLYDYDTDFALLANALVYNLPAWLEGPLLVLATLLLCLAGYELVRRLGWVRPLFGLKRTAAPSPLSRSTMRW